jgi:hypothetical protein
MMALDLVPQKAKETLVREGAPGGGEGFVAVLETNDISDIFQEVQNATVILRSSAVNSPTDDGAPLTPGATPTGHPDPDETSAPAAPPKELIGTVHSVVSSSRDVSRQRSRQRRTGDLCGTKNDDGPSPCACAVYYQDPELHRCRGGGSAARFIPDVQLMPTSRRGPESAVRAELERVASKADQGFKLLKEGEKYLRNSPKRKPKAPGNLLTESGVRNRNIEGYTVIPEAQRSRCSDAWGHNVEYAFLNEALMHRFPEEDLLDAAQSETDLDWSPAGPMRRSPEKSLAVEGMREVTRIHRAADEISRRQRHVSGGVVSSTPSDAGHRGADSCQKSHAVPNRIAALAQPRLHTPAPSLTTFEEHRSTLRSRSVMQARAAEEAKIVSIPIFLNIRGMM